MMEVLFNFCDGEVRILFKDVNGRFYYPYNDTVFYLQRASYGDAMYLLKYDVIDKFIKDNIKAYLLLKQLNAHVKRFDGSFVVNYTKDIACIDCDLTEYLNEIFVTPEYLRSVKRNMDQKQNKTNNNNSFDDTKYKKMLLL